MFHQAGAENAPAEAALGRVAPIDKIKKLWFADTCRSGGKERGRKREVGRGLGWGRS